MLGDTVIATIRAVAARNPDRVAIQAPGKVATTYADLIALIDERHASLARHGIGRGTRVAMLLPAGAETAVASLAVVSAATCVPLNPAYTSGEIAEFLEATRSDVVLTDPNLLHHVCTAAERLGLPVALLETGDAGAGHFDVDLAGVSLANGATGSPEVDDVALVLHTSGSTAKAKIVPLTQRNLVASMDNLVVSLALGPDDVCLNMMPLFHVGALVDLLFAPLSVGGSVVVTPAIASETFYDCLTAIRPTWYQGVPAMLQDIVRLAPDRLKPGDGASLRLIRAVSAPLPQKVQDDAEATFGVPVIGIYGMTETAGLIASNPLPPEARKAGSVGKPVGCTVAIADGEGNPVLSGARGEVIVSGDNVMAGYEGADEERRRSTFGKWLRTGDEGYLDDDGFLFLTGRIKEIVNRGGEKISPREIDACLAELAGVRQTAAYAIPHPTLGEDVAVAVVPEPGAELSEEAVRDHVARRLSRFKVPRHVRFLDALPRLPSGKLDRRTLAAGDSGATPHRANRRTPTDPLEALLVRLWKKILELDEIGLDDNFFDLGGDSLKATTLVMTLEEELGRDVPPGVLFDAPTIAELAASLLAGGTEGPAASNDEDERTRKAVAQAMAGWKGTRQSADSLLVGRNTLGGRCPLFWAFTAESEFANLAAHLDPERPVYAMRSLHGIGRKFHRDTGWLARHYVDEILRVQSDGPYLIGGFCEGAKLAVPVAVGLRRLGHEVALLALHDGFVPQPYDGAVTLLWSDAFPRLAADAARAERGWYKVYTGALAVHTAPGFHGGAYEEPGVAETARLLEQEFERALHHAPTPERAYPDVRPLDPATCRARVAAGVWPIQRQGREVAVAVTVRNASSVTWQPTVESGIALGARWLNLNLHPHGHLVAQADLVAPLAPGESRAFTLRVKVPARDRPMLLDIDMLEEGVDWFQERGSRPRRALVLPLRDRARRADVTVRPG